MRLARFSSIYQRSKEFVNHGGGLFHFKSSEEAGPRSCGHCVPFGGCQMEPAAQCPFCTFERIVVDQADAVSLNIRPNIYLVTDDDRTSNGKSLPHENSKVLLMRRQNAGFACR